MAPAIFTSPPLKAWAIRNPKKRPTLAGQEEEAEEEEAAAKI